MSGRPPGRPVLIGAAYYPEYLPAAIRDVEGIRQLDLMVEAGIDVIRVGESVWSSWEPRDGEFELEWLAPVLDEAAARGIRVILGTPSYAIPPWLQRKHPELAVRLADGRTVNWGARQEVDFTAPAFRMHAERVIRAVLGRHGGHPAVIGVQLDNEPGLHLMHNDGVVAEFVRRLQAAHGSVDALNEAWGLTYWSHRIAHWDELWHPSGNSTPAYNLVWRRFQAELTTEFIQWQAGIAREIVPADRWLTTCIALNRPAVDEVGLGGVLDVVSGNAYVEFQDSLAADAEDEHGTASWFSTSPVGLFQQADRLRAATDGPFLVTETAAGSIGGSAHNLPAFDGQIEQVAWALIARGAQLIGYWHWHTLHQGAEMYWGGVLGHDLAPRRTAAAIGRLAAGVRSAGAELEGLEPTVDVGFLFSRESRWAMQFHPPLTVPGARTPDAASYDRILGRFAEGAFDAGLQSGIVHTESLPSAAELLTRYRALILVGAVALSDEAAETIERYVELGGRLLLGIRSAVGDETTTARHTTPPGPLRRSAGLRISESSNLRRSLPLHRSDAAAGPSGTAEAWADGLELEGARALLEYGHPHFGRWPAAAEHRSGAGLVISCGTIPDRGSVAELLTRLVAGRAPRGPAAPFAALPVGVSAHSARNAAGAAVWVLHNWSAEPARVALAGESRDLLAPGHPVLGPECALPAWGVRVIRQAGPAHPHNDAEERTHA